MPVLRLLIEYDGTAFAGWQVQRGARTVQGETERALAVALRRPVGVVGAGRTDAGVHARGQVAHAVLDASAGDRPDLRRLVHSLRGLLPPDVALRDADWAPDGFHARYSATARHYRYHVTPRPTALERAWRLHVPVAPDWDAMNAAAHHLLGQRDFSSLCRTQSETVNRVCHVTRAVWVRDGGANDGAGDGAAWRFEISADRFLHGMVRTAVGTLLEVGRGRRTPDGLARVLDAADRRAAGPAAPPHGLVLHAVTYPDGAFAPA